MIFQEMTLLLFKGPHLGGLNGDAKWVSKIEELMNAVDEFIPDSNKTYRPKIF
jgi:elongation factor Tu